MVKAVPLYSLPQTIGAYPQVLVTFKTTTCGPCRRMPPILQQFVNQTGIPTVMVNLDEDMSQAQRYNISQVPTSVRYVGGRETGRVEGVPASVHALAALVR